jgi:hypothetical protein
LGEWADKDSREFCKAGRRNADNVEFPELRRLSTWLGRLENGWGGLVDVPGAFGMRNGPG